MQNYNPAAINLLPSLGSKEWLQENERAIKGVFPDDWKEVDRERILRLGHGLKQLGVNWVDPMDLPRILAFLERTGFVLRNGNLIKRNPLPVFRTH